MLQLIVFQAFGCRFGVNPVFRVSIRPNKFRDMTYGLSFGEGSGARVWRLQGRDCERRGARRIIRKRIAKSYRSAPCNLSQMESN